MNYFFSRMVFSAMHLPFVAVSFSGFSLARTQPCSVCFCSTWVMINLQTRKVAKIPEAMRQKLARFAPDPLRCTRFYI